MPDFQLRYQIGADNSQAKASFKEIDKLIDRLGTNYKSSALAGAVGGFAGGIVASFQAEITQLPVIFKQQIDEMVKIASDRQNAFKGLESLTTFLKIDSTVAQESVRNLRLVKAGIVEVGEASTALKNLLSAGFSLPESIKLLEAFSDTAAFGKSAALDFGEAIKGATEGIRNGNSILVDNVGLTKNLSAILKDAGFAEKDLARVKEDTNVRQALFNGLIKEALPQMGDANKLTKGWTGSTAALTTAKKNLYAAIGDVIINNKDLLALTQTLTGEMNELTGEVNKSGSAWKTNIDSMTSSFAKFVLDVQIGIRKEIAEFEELINVIQIPGAFLEGLVKSGDASVQDPFARFEQLKSKMGTFYKVALDYEKELIRDYNSKRLALPTTIPGLPTAQTPSGGTTTPGATEKEEAEKRRKAREAAFKQHLADLDAHIQLRLQTEREGFDASQADLEKNYLERNITEQQFLDNSYLNIKAYRTNVLALIRAGYLNDIKQATTALQKENARLSGNKSLAGLNAEIKRENEDIAKIITKSNKETSEERQKALAGWQKARDAQRQMYDITTEQIDHQRKERDEQKKHWKEHIDKLHKEGLLRDQIDAAEARKRMESKMVTAPGTFGGGIASAMGVDLVPMWTTVTDAMGNQVDVMISQADRMKMVYSDIKNFAGEAVGAMVDGLTQMAAAWLATGEFSAKAALQMLSAQAFSLATQAGFKAIFEYAESLAAAARYDFYSAGMHMAAAKKYLVVTAIAGAAGVGFGLGARAAGGGEGTSESGGSSSGSSSSESTSAYSRVSSNAYMSGRRPNSEIAVLARAVEKLEAKIDGVRPGDVLQRAIDQRPGLVGRATVKDIESNAGLGFKMRRASGAA